jgi:hypothetical protein
MECSLSSLQSGRSMRHCWLRSRSSAHLQVAAVEVDGSLVDAVVPNVDDAKAVFHSLKEAAATLSPIVRNRLHGIPQYILEYSDLVVANHVQAPFLKPILVTGPQTGERSTLLQALADEFPDVFSFAPVVSDEPEASPADPALTRYRPVRCAGWGSMSGTRGPAFVAA